MLSTYSFAQWESRSSGFSLKRGINQVISPSASVVWAKAYNSYIVLLPCRDYCKSVDGGNTFTPGTVNSAPSGSLWSCIAAVDENNAWALFINSTGPGTIWRTNDGGVSWNQQGAGVVYAGSTSFPDVINFWGTDTGVVIGDPLNGEFEIYTTSDGGTTWTLVDGTNIPDPVPGEYGFSATFSVYKNLLWFGTNKGRIYKSTDYGFTWSVCQTGLDNDAIYNMVYENEDTGWVGLADTANYFIGLYRTLNGGNTWTDITTTENFYVPYLCHVPNTANMLVSSGYHTDNFDVYGSSYSLDGGETWIDIDDSVHHLAVVFYDLLTGWSGDVNVDEVTGGMWKFDGDLATGLNRESQGDFFKLFPNPSDGLFYFSCTVENNEPIQITVTNDLGGIVFNKIYKDKSETWLRSINLRHFSRGIYFLRIENNCIISTQKLVVE